MKVVLRSSLRALAALALVASLVLAIAITIELRADARERTQLGAGQTFATLSTGRIRYRLTGRDLPGPAIVILNGQAAALEQWARVQARLAGLAPVLTYDRNFTGLSEDRAGRDAVGQTEELIELLDALRLRGPFVVVSYSSSGLGARVFARLHPEQVAGLVFLDPTSPEEVIDVPLRLRYDTHVIYERNPLILTAKALVGWLRFAARNKPVDPDPVEARAAQIIRWPSHWWAAFREGVRLERTAQEAAALNWNNVPAPVGLLSLGKKDGIPFDANRYRFHREMAPGKLLIRAPDGWEHPYIPTNPVYLPLLEELVAAVWTAAHERLAGASGTRKGPIEEAQQPTRVLDW
jgi:pimeloyl-ACP methyl ester carboxylesterase